jgi:hypothetical protein
MATTTRARGKRDVSPLEDLIVKMHRSAAGTAWRWRAEMTSLASLLAAVFWLDSQVTIVWAAVVLAAAHAAIFGEPHSRRFVVRRFWCVLDRHRFHRLCWETRLHTRSGRLPWVLWTRSTNVGERLHVWCLAGISAEDFEKHNGELAAACYARAARVARNTRWSHIVTIDIIRRDTLAAKSKVSSPLARLATVYPDAVNPALVPVAATGPDGPPAWPQEATTPPA